MGRYPLIIYFYTTLPNMRFYSFLWRVFVPTIKYLHIAVSVDKFQYFSKHGETTKIIKSTVYHKIRPFDTFIFLGLIKLENLSDIHDMLPPRKVVSKNWAIVWGICRHFKIFRYFGMKEPAFCSNLACEILNDFGIPIPNYVRIEKIRRWLYENHFVLWEGRLGEDNNCERVDAPSF